RHYLDGLDTEKHGTGWESLRLTESMQTGIHGNVSDDLIALSESVVTGLVGEDSARRLLKAAIIKADDKTLWDEVLAVITASLTATTRRTRSIVPQNTPPASTSTAAARPGINSDHRHQHNPR
ncbi:hypothetical protein E4U52_004877, partial [Claviceps spartinae]